MTHYHFREIGEILADRWGLQINGDVSETIKTMPADQRMYCLLSSIVSVLQKQDVTDSDRLDAHHQYMCLYWDEDLKKHQDVRKHVKRILIMCCGNDLILQSGEIRFYHNPNVMSLLSEKYVFAATKTHNFNDFLDTRARLHSVRAKLSKVTEIDHLLWMPGIGKARLKKLKEYMEQQRRDK